MAIAFVQKQSFEGAGLNSIQVILTSVAAGNFLAVCNAAFVNSPGYTNTAPSSSPTNSWNTTTAPTGTANANAAIAYAMNVASGTTTITMDYGTPLFFLAGSASEFSGIETTAALDTQAQNNATSTTPSSGTTTATAQADELVLASLSVSGSDTTCGIDVPATTGYTNLHVQQDANTIQGHSSDYKIVSATATQSAAWGTMDGSYVWQGKIATFKAAAAAGPGVRIKSAKVHCSIGWK